MWAPWRMEYILSESEDKSDDCIFCTFPAEKNDEKNLIVYRSEFCFIILNKYPYNNAHIMVVPYNHVSDILELDEKELLDIQKTIQKSVRVLRKEVRPHAMNIGMNLGRLAGAGIDEHLHYHIVPRWDGDTNFMPVLTDTKVISESLNETWQRLYKGFKDIS
jgi:ATP adenylyltransferase